MRPPIEWIGAHLPGLHVDGTQVGSDSAFSGRRFSGSYEETPTKVRLSYWWPDEEARIAL